MFVMCMEDNLFVNILLAIFLIFSILQSQKKLIGQSKNIKQKQKG